jgi:hypothetical protein
MKREFVRLSRVEQERVELEYHRTKPEGFDDLMAGSAHNLDGSFHEFSRIKLGFA